MNTLCDFLEDFGQAHAPVQSAGGTIDEGELESRRLAAFEEGYRAGWDDADKNHAEAAGAVSDALGQQLQDLSFTYQEAYSQMVGAVSPLLEEVVSTLLPALARETIGVHVAQTLQELSSEIGTVTVKIAVAPQNLDSLAPLVDGAFAFPVEVVADDSLSEDQADLRFGTTEKQIDFGDVIQTVRDAVQGFAHDNMRKLSNG